MVINKDDLIPDFCFIQDQIEKEGEIEEEIERTEFYKDDPIIRLCEKCEKEHFEDDLDLVDGLWICRECEGEME